MENLTYPWHHIIHITPKPKWSRDRVEKERQRWSREKMSGSDDRLTENVWTKERHEYPYTLLKRSLAYRKMALRENISYSFCAQYWVTFSFAIVLLFPVSESRWEWAELPNACMRATAEPTHWTTFSVQAKSQSVTCNPGYWVESWFGCEVEMEGKNAAFIAISSLL